MKKLLLAFIMALISVSAHAEIKTQVVDYSYEGVTLKGYLAWDDAISGKRPGVMVVHEWWGLNDYARKRTEQLARLGYVAFAADMYGDGKSTTHPEEAGKMMGAVRENMKTWLGRANAALQVLRDNPLVDAKSLAAIGYCFGGATVLQMAYSGADLAAVVSFHGALVVPNSTQAIKARILILHGAEDPFVTADTIEKLKAALDQGKVKYKFIAYTKAVHGFTNPDADKAGMKGVAYQAEADRLSWQEMLSLFHEVMGPGK
ncbi:MAG: dienelactone hydrolase family protein [Deltaproteobacteria bacterium]|nr:dienelactone hydrolase family protein [Deltaproteobacteria bacterium]